MRIAIVGAGAIGGFLAARLGKAGLDVTLVSRGRALEVLRRDGLTLLERDGSRTHQRMNFAESLDLARAPDYVILAVKAYQVEGALAGLEGPLDPSTTVVPMQNGIPFWYFQRHGGPHEGRAVLAVDPRGHLSALVPATHILGCVVYPACELVSPGVVRHVEGERFPLGELDGSESHRALALSGAFTSAGLKAPVLPDIRAELWLKLWGNLTFNPVSALTRATLDRICGEPLTRALATGMMEEAREVAGKLGIGFRVPLERRIEGAARVGNHKTSMLQDIESGRATEIDALLGSVIELAHLTGTAVPRIETVYACTRLLEESVRIVAPAAKAA